MPYKRESKARRRKTKLKQGLISTATEFHDQSPAQLLKNKRKPRDSGSWFVTYMKSIKRKHLYGHRCGKKRGGKDSNFEGDTKKVIKDDKNRNKQVKKVPKGAFEIDNERGTQLLFKRQNGETSSNYKARLRMENAKAILEEKKKNSTSNTRLKRKRYLKEQKLRRKNKKKQKRQRTNNSSDDEDNIYEKVKFGDRVKDIPKINERHKFQGGGNRKVITLLSDNNPSSSKNALDIGDRKSYSQMDELAKKVNFSYYARQL
eukprot:g9472.t1